MADGSPVGTFVVGATAASQQTVCTGNVSTYYILVAMSYM